MSAPEELLEQETELREIPDSDGLDEIHGYADDDCWLIWVGGFDPTEMGLDPDSPSLGDSARNFAESAKHLTSTDETSPGYFDCIFCNVTGISGKKIIALTVP